MITIQFPSEFPVKAEKKMLTVNFQDKLFLDFSNVTNITKKEAYLIIGELWKQLGNDFSEKIISTEFSPIVGDYFTDACKAYSENDIAKIQSVINQTSDSNLFCRFGYTSNLPTIFFSRYIQ